MGNSKRGFLFFCLFFALSLTLHCSEPQTPPSSSEKGEQVALTETQAEEPTVESTLPKDGSPRDSTPSREFTEAEVTPEAESVGEPASPELQKETTSSTDTPFTDQHPADSGQVPESSSKCASDKDCPKASCSGSNPCNQVLYRCEKGACVRSSGAFAGQSCDSNKGYCVPPSCHSHCDCPQGYQCQKNKCFFGIKALYCCEKATCPRGQPCTHRSGKADFCIAGGTGKQTCTSSQGYCAAQGVACKKDFRENKAFSCKSSLLKCCQLIPKTNQCTSKGGRCIGQKTKCLSNEKEYLNIACSVTQEKCCIKVTPTPDCTKQGGVCYNLSTACKPGYSDANTVSCGSTKLKCCLPTKPQCQTDADCGKPTCYTSPKGCAETTPKCVNKRCQGWPTVKKGTCDPKTGKCT